MKVPTVVRPDPQLSNLRQHLSLLEEVMTAPIAEEDIIHSVADALQYISYYHPPDYIRHLNYAYEAERSPSAKDAIAQILVNSRMSALGKRPLWQDTGLVSAFVKVGMNARFATARSLSGLIDEGVRLAYTDQNNTLRASMVFDPLFARKNTRDNSPAVVHAELVPGGTPRHHTLCEGRRVGE